MQPPAIVVNLRASKLGRTCLFGVTLLITVALLLHPQFWISSLLLPLLGYVGYYWHLNFGALAPRQLELRQGRWWLTDAQGESFLLPLPPCWRSYLWLAFTLPWRPWGWRAWLLWPDSLTAEERRQLRALLPTKSN